jgi:transmembrane sensor
MAGQIDMTHNHRQIERDAALWLARRDAGGWAERQQRALEAWLAEDTAHRVAFLRLQAAWEESARLQALAAGDAGGRIAGRGEWAHSPYFAPSINRQRAVMHGRRAAARKRRRWPVFAAIATSLLVAAAVAGGFAWRDYAHVDRAAWKTATGGRQVVQLPDGSTATLGSGTTLQMAFAHGERDLELGRGEAFFDVAHDAARPFVVRANGYRVIAVGTRFDVRRDAGRLRVVVTRGLVRLQSAHDPARPPAMLPAGSIATVAGDDVAISRVSVDEAREALSWRSGFVVFHRTPLAEAVREFNRYNTRQIVIADSSLDALRVGGNFRLDNSDAFVRLMQAVFPVQAEQRGREILLTRKSEARAAH